MSGVPKDVGDAAPQSASPLDRQVGGDHYQAHVIQPIEIAMGNRLRATHAFALKHVCRPGKDQVRQDIEKCLHYLDLGERKWTPVDPNAFQRGLDVPEWMREVAYSIVLIDNPMADSRAHRDRARRILREQLQRLDRSEPIV